MPSPPATNIGSRFYLMAGQNKYQMFTLLGNEFTMDVDVSKLGCGLNGAVYFVSMDEDGGQAKYSTNKAGAKFGTGYCDAQCPRDLKFINGEVSWQQPSPGESRSQLTRTPCRPTRLRGRLLPTIRTPVSVATARAALRWTSGT